MKIILFVLVIGIFCFLDGYLIGSRPVDALKFAQRETSQLAILDQAAVLGADLHIATDLHQGNAEKALHSVVLRIDANLVSLAEKQSSVSKGINTNQIIDYALNFRRTNLWMNDYGLLSTNTDFEIRTNSVLAANLQKLLSRP